MFKWKKRDKIWYTLSRYVILSFNKKKCRLVAKSYVNYLNLRQRKKTNRNVDTC